MDIMETATTNILMRLSIEWNILASAGLGKLPSKPLEIDKIRLGLSFLDFLSKVPIWQALNARCCLLPVSYDEKLCPIRKQALISAHSADKSLRIDALQI